MALDGFAIVTSRYRGRVLMVVDPINPNYYQMPDGTQLISITKWLTGCGAQAVQYVARATRIDQQNKGEVIQDLTKAIWFIQQEIDRLKGDN